MTSDLYCPRTASYWQEMSNLITGRQPEYVDSDFVAKGNGREGNHIYR